MGSVPVTVIRKEKQDTLVQLLLPATIDLCRSLGLNITETFSVWRLTYLRFIYIPKYGVTRAELHNYILSIIADRDTETG